jgi:hypothetical protein
MNRWIRIFVPLTLLLVATLACQLGGIGSTTPEPPPPAEQTTESTDESPQPEEAEIEQGAAGESELAEGEPLSLSSISDGLDTLDSYTSHATVAYTSQTEGGTVAGTIEMDIATVREPLAQRIVLRTPDMEGTLEFVRVGDRQYASLGEGQCVSTSAGEETPLDPELLDLDELFGGVSDARRVLPDETVNGTLCHRYAFDETALVEVDGITHAEGELWVAANGGYVVRYAMHAEGKEPVTGLEGQFEFLYELDETNVSVEIEPPDGCEASGRKFPLMPDASDVTRFGEMLTYTSASALDDIVSFYREQMAALDWELAEEPFVSEDTAMVTFTRDGQSVTVTLSVEDGSVAVVILSE